MRILRFVLICVMRLFGVRLLWLVWLFLCDCWFCSVVLLFLVMCWSILCKMLWCCWV